MAASGATSRRSRASHRFGGVKPARRWEIPIEARFKVANAIDPFQMALEANIEALKDVSAYVAAVAKNLARKRNRSSPKGQAWSSHVGSLKRGIQWDLDVDSQSSAIGPGRARGPANDPTSKAPRALEYGGMNTITVNQITSATVRGQNVDPAEIARRRGIRKDTRRARAARRSRRRTGRRPRSPGELTRIREYYGEGGGSNVRSVKKRITVRVEPRPTMHIALARSINRLPIAWKYAYYDEARTAKKFFRTGTDYANWRRMVMRGASKAKVRKR